MLITCVSSSQSLAITVSRSYNNLKSLFSTLREGIPSVYTASLIMFKQEECVNKSREQYLSMKQWQGDAHGCGNNPYGPPQFGSRGIIGTRTCLLLFTALENVIYYNICWLDTCWGSCILYLAGLSFKVDKYSYFMVPFDGPSIFI